MTIRSLLYAPLILCEVEVYSERRGIYLLMLMIIKVIMAVVMIYSTNSFHVAVRRFSNTSQMTSKCGKNKKVAHEA